MKIKELQKTVNIAWSPAQLNNLYLAAGTAAQQIDASLNSNSTLELYEIDLSDPGYDFVLKASQNSPYRFHKIVWSPLGINSTQANGVIAAGCEGGHLQLYSAAKMFAGEEALIAVQDKHTGAVRALDYNPFQTNLLASGASESDILIWDLNNTTTPMTPGTKTQPLEDIQNIAWNRQVQHILASVFSSRCVVWDLRKNEPIIKLSDSQSRVRFRALQWHPNIATQLWLASEDDQAPVVQLWDLRYATAPAKTLQIHQRGVLGLTWCPKDTDLMVSCGKDNKILCWNPNMEQAGDEILSEIASTFQWYSDVQWCPRNPALIASSSLDGNVSVYSVNGGAQQQVQTTNKIADSFPGMDTISQAPVPSNTSHVVYSDLKRPPKWFKQPIGAKFGFGGKLISFRTEANGARIINISQVITEPELIERSNKLEETLSSGNYGEYCRQKADESQDQHNRYVWYFLKANFGADPRSEMLNLLGYNTDDIQTKFNTIIDKNVDDDIGVVNKKLADLGRSDSSEVEGSISTTTNESTDLSTTDNAAVFDSIGAQAKLKTESDDGNDEIPYKIRTGEDNEGLICQALLTGNIEAAVDLCLQSNRTADAIIIATTGGSDLLARTQYRYLKKSQSYLSNIISALVTEDWSSVISQCTIDSWKEALVATLTHCRESVPVLCERLGERLQEDGGNGSNLSVVQSAILCYICAGNVERLAETWLITHTETAMTSTKELQDLIEVVVLFQKALELQGRNPSASGRLAELLTQYGNLLAAQGALSSALTYLGPSDDPKIVELRERIYYSLGHKQAYATRSASQAQNIYAKSQTPNKFMQPRTSLTTGLGFNAPQQQPPTSVLNATFNAPNVQSPPKLWNNTATNHFQSQQYAAPAPFASNPPPNVPASTVAGNEHLSHPPRPSSVSSQTGTAPHSRSKYILDPSVQSSGSAGGYGHQPAANSFASNTPFNAQLYGNTASNSSYGQPFNTAPFTNPTTNSFNSQPFNSTPLGQPSILNPPALNSFVPGVPPIELAQPAVPQPTHTQRNPTPPPGWNDPPALKSTRPARASSVDASHNNVITCPLSGGQPSAQNYGQNGYADYNAPPTSYQGTVFTPPQNPSIIPTMAPQQIGGLNAGHQPTFQTQLPSQPQFNTMQSQSYGGPPSSLPDQTAANVTRIASPEPKAKAPIPEEYVYLQTVFNELKTQCINTATNPQIKRKLDDVGKRLESLYDLLREYRLTPNTLDSLNKLVQLVQIGDYANGLGLHTQMVSGPDFAQIASFMPGIKVLLQTAMQLQVYLR